MYIGGCIPSSSYQLWFIYYLVIGYTIVYSGLSLSKERKQRVIYFVLLTCFSTCINIYICQVLTGASFGILCKEYNWNKRVGKMRFILLISASVILIPVIYNEHRINNITMFISGLLFSIIMVSLTSVNNTKGICNLMDNYCMRIVKNNTFSVYVVHGLVLEIVGKIYSFIVSKGMINDAFASIIVFYVMSLVITVAVGELYNRYVIITTKKYINCIYLKYIQ